MNITYIPNIKIKNFKFWAKKKTKFNFEYKF